MAQKSKKGRSVKKKSPLGILGVYIGCLCIISILLGVFLILNAKPVPEPFRMAHGAPEGAEILQRSEMSPGTFLIFKDLEFILEKAQGSPEKLDVAWSEGGFEYWFPKEGTNREYYSKRVPETGWGSDFLIEKVELIGQYLVFYPCINTGPIATTFLISFILGILALVCWLIKSEQ